MTAVIDGTLQNTAVFPNNVVILLRNTLATLPGVYACVARPLRNSDPVVSIGVFAADWTPGDGSDSGLEIRGPARPGEPTISTYRFVIQAFVKHGDQAEGLAAHSVLSKLVRSMLYRNTTLHASLRGLQEQLDGTTEKARKWGISQQRFHNNELDGAYLYLSSLEYWLQTETV